MISLESDKICKHLFVSDDPNVRLQCIKSKLHSGQIITAPCMMDPHAGAFIKPELCELYQTKGGEIKDDKSKK
jgi:hypothetical protein